MALQARTDGYVMTKACNTIGFFVETLGREGTGIEFSRPL